MSKIIIATLLIVLSISVNGQITVNNIAPYNDENYLVNNVLAGSGVVASNISFTGNPDQIGFFDNGDIGTNNIGLTSGVLISTGNVNDVPSGGSQPNQNYQGAGDNDLLTIAQSVRPGISSSHDAATLEFDFDVVGDTVEFRFVFASDEYLTWINSDYNDVFAFFLSGPGINGPYSSPNGFPNGSINVALVPGVTPPTPITISTIHPGLNSQFYKDNAANLTHDFNGYTVVMTARYPVQCGERYHFRFAIADCEDETLDTGVFIEAGSLTSSGVTIDADLTSLIEDCGDIGRTTVTITRSDTLFNDIINLNVSGSVDASDYSPFNTQVVFDDGETEATFEIVILSDNIVEGTDTLILEIQGNTGCNEIVLYIDDYIEMSNVVVSDSLNICTDLGETGQIFSSVSGGLGPYIYFWNDGVGPGDTLIVSPEETIYYTPTIWDACGKSIKGEAIPVWVQCPLSPTNVFTPNGDGFNDFFSIINLDDYESPSIKVYNRWGRMVYESDAYNNDWDGGDLEQGTYFYIVTPNNTKYLYDDGAKEELKYTIKGTVQLFR
jgi:gliding motility-associated-like protein